VIQVPEELVFETVVENPLDVVSSRPLIDQHSAPDEYGQHPSRHRALQKSPPAHPPVRAALDVLSFGRAQLRAPLAPPLLRLVEDRARRQDIRPRLAINRELLAPEQEL